VTALLKRAPDWPVELHEAADEYEKAMDGMEGMAAREIKARPKDAVELLKKITKARDRFVRLRSLYQEGKLI
jgi:hypothetical protein